MCISMRPELINFCVFRFLSFCLLLLSLTLLQHSGVHFLSEDSQVIPDISSLESPCQESPMDRPSTSHQSSSGVAASAVSDLESSAKRPRVENLEIPGVELGSYSVSLDQILPEASAIPYVEDSNQAEDEKSAMPIHSVEAHSTPDDDDDEDDEVGSMRRHLSYYKQEHVLRYWETLNDEQQSHLGYEYSLVDFDRLQAGYERAHNPRTEVRFVYPIEDRLREGVAKCTPEQLALYRHIGLQAIGAGKVALLLLAGTKDPGLGISCPIGMFNFGLPSGKAIYQLQAERLLRLQELAAQQTGNEDVNVPWYIMTSKHTMKDTQEFFESHDDFGLDVVVFEQEMLPLLTLDGSIILETPYSMAMQPNGNGDLFQALKYQDILGEMKRSGIQYVHVYSVDNILVKMADPVFIGYSITKQADCAVKIVEKVNPREAVGVLCMEGGHFQVTHETVRTEPDGSVPLNTANICNYIFTVDFLLKISEKVELERYNRSYVKIGYVGADGQMSTPTEANGIILERYISDAFIFSERFAIWEVEREAEFAPLKNTDEFNTPTAARNALYAHHRELIRRAGGRFSDIDTEAEEQICEISPLLSYDGEGLEALVSGKIFSFPLSLPSPHEPALPIVSEANSGGLISHAEPAPTVFH